MAKIIVEDNGIGIPQRNLKNIFRRFYQVDSSYTRKFKGAGLGLAICKRIVELHFGKIEVETKLQKGTRFTITMPIAKSHK